MTGGLSGPESFHARRALVPSWCVPRLSLTGSLPETSVLRISTHSGGESSFDPPVPPPQPALAAARPASASTAARTTILVLIRIASLLIRRRW